MKHTRVVSTKCTPGFACRAFSDTTLVCFIVNEHIIKCSRYRNEAVPDYRSLVTLKPGMDICQIGVYFDNRGRFAIWMGSIRKATEPCQQTSGCWHLTFDSFLNLDMGDDTNTKFLLLRVQTTYMTKKMRGDCWGTWLIMLGFMDLGWPRVCRRSMSVLFVLFNSLRPSDAYMRQ